MIISTLKDTVLHPPVYAVELVAGRGKMIVSVVWNQFHKHHLLGYIVFEWFVIYSWDMQESTFRSVFRHFGCQMMTWVVFIKFE